MIDATTFAPFALASAIVILVPGSDVFLLLRVSLTHGLGAGLRALAGIHLGNVAQAVLMVSGIGLLISQLPAAVTVLRVLGAGYLLYLAWGSVVTLRQSLKKQPPADNAHQPEPAARARARTPFMQGLLTNVTNPKVLLFFVAFFPQFLGTAQSAPLQLLALSTIFIGLAIVWELVIVVAASRLRPLMKSRRFNTAMEAICALAFTGLAVMVLIPSA